MMHLYCGDGKGKTTAAMGLVARAAGRGWPVCVVQFLKDGSSGELETPRATGRVTVLACARGVTFSFRMSPAQRADARRAHDANLRQAIGLVRAGEARMLVLDEACAALRAGLLDEGLVREAVRACRAREAELVVTGRNPPAWLQDEADYVTEMRCVRHPYQGGVAAREGVEY